MKRRADGAATAVPPDPRRTWAAEVEWREAEDRAYFVATARPSGSGAVATIAESRPLAWPPTDGDSVQALGQAASDLELTLVGAGWTPVAPGPVWYAKRFAWEPAASPGGELPTAEIAALFAPRPPWPESTAGRWRCEISWDAGWARSRFRVLAYAPGERRGREIRSSRALPWLLMAQPDATSDEHRREVESLIGALSGRGWEPVGTGAGWYARRFYWPGDDEPGESSRTPIEATDVRDRDSHAYGTVVSHPEDEMERVLRSARPTPRPGFVRELEQSLPLSPRRRAAPRLRLAIAGAGLAAGLAVVALVAGIAGLLPGSSGSPRGAQARPNCRQVVVERRTRQAYFVKDRQGAVHVRYRYVLTPRPVKRCR